nr:unnamed protein product [Callosobruchus analis]
MLVKLSDTKLCLGTHKSSSQQYTTEIKEYPQQKYTTGAQLRSGGQPYTSSPQQYTPTTPQQHSTQTPEQYYPTPHQYNSTMSHHYTSPKPSPSSLQQYTPNTPPQYGVPTHDMYTPTPKQYISPIPQQYASTSKHNLAEPQLSKFQGSKALSPESETLHVGAQDTERQEQGLPLRPHRSPRTILLKDQIALMKAVYDVNQNPSKEVKERLVKATGLPIKVIKIWFQNRRQKSRKEMQEAEAVN